MQKTQVDNSNGLNEEISIYLTMKDHKESALEFWQEKEKLLPTLAQMAKVYLCLSPGSVSVESLFSTTGLILNSKRSSLDPFRCNMITFVHDNNKFLNWFQNEFNRPKTKMDMIIIHNSDLGMLNNWTDKFHLMHFIQL